ncbi:bifunctional hydroxymethylpyrimidine kinase/phosphomethylpyrimidine kinase [Nocardioides aquiterrae]|uniref:Bifunctional hydroxymethylpyrimidine kinase/phosphomethylpyrimidine kinase n=1 Tax=Nocardioides aquiterrae TaxID=203799 RepID=A0ABP4EWD1_9ACTN
MTPPVVLTIAATDSGGGAGVAADLATFAALGVHGACVVTAVTAQDTLGMHAIHRVPPEVVAAQLNAVLGDLPVAAVKTGMLGDPAVVRLVADRCHGLPLVVDPVLRATTGARLADDSVVAAYLDALLPGATVVTPNTHEATVLGPLPVPCVRTGSETAVDVLVHPDGSTATIAHDPVDTANDHGTGCTFSAALAAHLAHGRELPDATRLAGAFTAGQLRRGRHWNLGRGRGPIAHTTNEGAPA